MKKNREDESIWVLIHIYIEMSQGKSLCSYLITNNQKCHFFLLSSIKSNRREEQVLPDRGIGTSGRERSQRKVGRGKIQYKKCVHVYVNAKMIPVETIPGLQGEQDEGECWMA
jgi:hypothetical protein